MKNLPSTMYGLGLHTNTPQLGLAISDFQDYHKSQTWDLGRETSAYLHQHLQEFLQPQTWQDLQFIAVARGPGGFTGTRIGLVTARIIGQQLQIPVYAISSLSAIAWSARNDYPDQVIPVQMQARRGQLFVGVYRYQEEQWQTQLEDRIMTRESWHQTLDKLQITTQPLEISENLGSTVTSVLELGYRQWQQALYPQWFEALPYYGEHPVTG